MRTRPVRPAAAPGDARSRRAARLAAAGALAGVVLAVTSVVRAPQGAGPPVGAVAQINDVVLSREDFARSLEALATDRRAPVDGAERQHVLDRMVDEELLVQRGLTLGLARHDRQVRADLVSAVIAAVTADAEALAPGDAELRRFFTEHRDELARTARLRVQQVYVEVPPGADPEDRRQRAVAAANALRLGTPIEEVRQRFGDREPLALPDGLLPPDKLQDYIGPTATRTALGLAAGAVADPVRSTTGFHVLRVLQRQTAAVPPFEEVRTQVLAEYRRRAGEQAVRAYLDDLRARAHVAVVKDP